MGKSGYSRIDAIVRLSLPRHANEPQQIAVSRCAVARGTWLLTRMSCPGAKVRPKDDVFGAQGRRQSWFKTELYVVDKEIPHTSWLEFLEYGQKLLTNIGKQLVAPSKPRRYRSKGRR